MGYEVLRTVTVFGLIAFGRGHNLYNFRQRLGYIHANRSVTMRMLPKPFEAFRKAMSAYSRSQTLFKIEEIKWSRMAF